MERLTYRLEDQYGNPTDSIILESDLIFLNSSEKWKKVLSRLAAYEDTGLEPEEIKEFAEDVIRQFAYHGQVNGRCAYTAGGLSTLEWAFQICGWDDPHPCPECECEVKNCHEWATGGRPTTDGYKFLCSRHYMAYEAREEAEAALAKERT